MSTSRANNQPGGQRRLSPSSARIQGDDYQHLLTWLYALEMLSPGEQAPTSIEVEAEDAGSVDDIVVYRPACTEYIQVKYAVDGRTPNKSDWWTQKQGQNSQSLLQKFWQSWNDLKDHQPLTMVLFTNRQRDLNDPIMQCIAGRDGILMPKLANLPAGSAGGRKRAAWAKHLGVEEADMLDMFDHLRIKDQRGTFKDLTESVQARHWAAGLSPDDAAVKRGLACARNWVASRQHVIDPGMLQKEIQRLKLVSEYERQATLLVQEIAYDPWPESASWALDWVGLFDGPETRARRRIVDPAAWNERMRPDLADSALRIGQMGYRRVQIRGAMRLPSWFAAGVEFADTAGWQVRCERGGVVWDSGAVAVRVIPERRRTRIGQGEDLAVGLSIARDVAPAVRRYIREERLSVGTYLDFAPADGPSGQAIPDAATARGWAVAVRDAVQRASDGGAGRTVHLFMAVPAGVALLLGHIWNHVPTTQVYAPLNPGYAPAYTIPA